MWDEHASQQWRLEQKGEVLDGSSETATWSRFGTAWSYFCYLQEIKITVITQILISLLEIYYRIRKRSRLACSWALLCFERLLKTHITCVVCATYWKLCNRTVMVPRIHLGQNRQCRTRSFRCEQVPRALRQEEEYAGGCQPWRAPEPHEGSPRNDLHGT